jgi:hypothetical protein
MFDLIFNLFCPVFGCPDRRNSTMVDPERSLAVGQLLTFYPGRTKKSFGGLETPTWVAWYCSTYDGTPPVEVVWIRSVEGHASGDGTFFAQCTVAITDSSSLCIAGRLLTLIVFYIVA